MIWAIKFHYSIARRIIINEKTKVSYSMALNLIEEGEQIKEILKEKITQDNQITEYMLSNLVPKIWPTENP